MAATDARPLPLKGSAYREYFAIFDTSGKFVPSAAGLDSEVSLDGGTFTDCTNEATQIGTSGIYYLDLTAGETAADCVLINVKTTSLDTQDTLIRLYPQESGDIHVDLQTVGGASRLVAGVELTEALRRIGASGSGKVTGGRTGSEVFKDWADAACFTVVADSNGNRSSITFS